jgi:hypothetical protein
MTALLLCIFAPGGFEQPSPGGVADQRPCRGDDRARAAWS